MNAEQIILTGLSREDLRADLREIVREEVAALPQLQKPKKYLTLDETSALTGMSKSKLYQLTSGRKIPFIKRYGKLLFSYEEVIQWMEEARQPVDNGKRYYAFSNPFILPKNDIAQYN